MLNVDSQVIRWMIVMVLGIYICLFFFEDLPVSLILCGLLAQVMLTKH